MRISLSLLFYFLSTRHPFLLLTFDSSPLALKKKIHLLLCVASLVIALPRLTHERTRANQQTSHQLLKKHNTRTTHTQKPKPKVKRCLKNQSNRQSRRKRRPRTRTSTSTIRCVFLFFPLARSRSLARGISFQFKNRPRFLVRHTPRPRIFLGALSLFLSLARSRSLRGTMVQVIPLQLIRTDRER